MVCTPAGSTRRDPHLSAAYLLTHVALPLLIGGGIYLLWRDPSLLMFRWLDALGLDGLFIAPRAWVAPLRPSLPDWLLFSVPDGAWVYACVAFFARLWRDGPPLPRWLWTALGPALALGGEVGQLAGVVPGTWDIVDVAWYAIAGLVAWLFAAAPWRRRTRSGGSTAELTPYGSSGNAGAPGSSR